MKAAGLNANVKRIVCDSPSPGTMVFLRAMFSKTTAGAFALGARGKPSETVADEAVGSLLEFLASGAAVDAHAADQLITLAALCDRQSRLTTERITDHLRTNAEVITQMTGREVRIEGQSGKPGTVTVAGMGEEVRSS